MTGSAFGSAELVNELIPQQAAWEEMVERSGHVRYNVVHHAVLGVPRSPDDRYKLASFELQHAVPTLRPWSEPGDSHGAVAVSFSPESGGLEHSEEYGSDQVKWTLRSGLEAGAEFVFETKFGVVSCERVFNVRDAETSWESYKNTVVKVADVDRVEDIPDELVRAAEKIRDKNDPHEAVLEFCEWMRGEMSYDVRWDHADLEAILDKGVGHSLHFVVVLQALCRVAEIPFRQVFGMRLTEEDGLEEELIGIRQDFANRFFWGEVFFPEYGWIEVEPTLQDDPFSIPVYFVQSNRLVQNQSLEVIGLSEGGERVLMPLWRYDRTAWKPNYLKEDLISFTEERHRVGEISQEKMATAAAAAEGPADPGTLIDEREWTDVTGRKMVAALEKFADETKRVLVFRRSDGKEFEFSVERLSEADRAFLSNALEGE